MPSLGSLIKITKTHLYNKLNKIALDQQLNPQFSIDQGCTNILEISFSSTDLRSSYWTHKYTSKTQQDSTCSYFHFN